MGATFTYDMAVPDDAPDDEVDGYREIAVKLWETSAETMGAYGATPTATLVHVDDPGTATDPLTGQPAPLPRRHWHIEGPVA